MIREELDAALAAAAVDEGLVVPDTIGLEQPASREHGDWSSNIALATAKQAGEKPRDLAARLVARLEARRLDHVDRVEVAGPGFVNFHLRGTWLHDVVREVLVQGVDGFCRSDFGSGRRVIVEFVSVNPTGPLHAGHGRGAVYGDAVARLLEQTGHSVTRESYLNDRGVQMQTFAASLAARRAGEEPPADGYMGSYIAEWAAEMPDDADPLSWGYERALADQREVLALLGIEFDVWFSEASLLEGDSITRSMATLRERRVVYDDDGAVWLRSTAFGDDKDRVLVKSDGDYTYLLPDIAYHADKFSRADELVNVFGADHHGYVARLKAAMQALGYDPDLLDVRINQLVKLVRDGKEVRLSKRTGELVELRDVVEEVGTDATRFTFLLQSIDSQQTFDLAVAASQAMENPVFYSQYAHARIASILRKVAEAGTIRLPVDAVDLSLLEHHREVELMRCLFGGPEAVEIAARERAPHRVVGWVRELAAAFHGFYHDCYVMGAGVSPELTQARLQLVEATRIALVVGFDLLGVSAPDEMWTGGDE